jgi:hypothetical protein
MFKTATLRRASVLTRGGVGRNLSVMQNTDKYTAMDAYKRVSMHISFAYLKNAVLENGCQ